MNSLPHIPALRRGRAYENLDQVNVIDHRTDALLVFISQVNTDFIRRDLAKVAESRALYAWAGVAEVRPYGTMKKNIVEGVY